MLLPTPVGVLSFRQPREAGAMNLSLKVPWGWLRVTSLLIHRGKLKGNTAAVWSPKGLFLLLRRRLPKPALWGNKKKKN